MEEKRGGKNKRNEEYGNYRENKTTEKVYEINTDKELNKDSRTADHDDNRNNDNKEHITRAKGRQEKEEE